MTNNADEKNQRQQDLELALNWLADAREWAKLAKHLHTVTEALSDNDSARTSKLNVARAMSRDSISANLQCVSSLRSQMAEAR